MNFILYVYSQQKDHDCSNITLSRMEEKNLIKFLIIPTHGNVLLSVFQDK